MLKKIIPLGGLVAVAIGVAVAMGAFREQGPAVNPDPNHTHADFAVWIMGTKLDFADERYMSEAPVAPVSDAGFWFIETAMAHEGVEHEDVELIPNSKRKYLHLHDGNGQVIHSHKPGQTIGDFFESIGFAMTTTCMTIDGFQFDHLDQAAISDFALTPELCTNGKFHWQMIVNGTEVAFDPAYTFNDLDKILLVYQSGDMWQEQYDQLSDDACLYSRTCPERGDPPTENCIADPEVPCVIPE